MAVDELTAALNRENIALRAENERLRSVLKRIASSHGASDHSCFRRDLAGRALAESSDQPAGD